MKILRTHHRYELTNFENTDKGQIIQFIEKVPKEGGLPGELETINDGTTNEEVLKVLINRLSGLNEKFPSRENAIVITKLEECLMWLEKRTKDRQARGVEGKALV